jgi:hypothetical protein
VSGRGRLGRRVARGDSDPCNSITGGYVVRDPTLETLRGRYIYGDYCTGDVDAAVLRGERQPGPA